MDARKAIQLLMDYDQDCVETPEEYLDRFAGRNPGIGMGNGTHRVVAYIEGDSETCSVIVEDEFGEDDVLSIAAEGCGSNNGFMCDTVCMRGKTLKIEEVVAFLEYLGIPNWDVLVFDSKRAKDADEILPDSHSGLEHFWSPLEKKIIEVQST